MCDRLLEIRREIWRSPRHIVVQTPEPKLLSWVLSYLCADPNLLLLTEHLRIVVYTWTGHRRHEMR